jgi:hypothetical protein
MTTTKLAAEKFYFVDRPIPIPGDLRLSWRIPVLLLMLHHSRQARSSLIKLHVLNDALRSSKATQQLRMIITDNLPPLFWQPRIEPTFARAIDFATGDRLVEWISTSNGPGLTLTPSGRSVVGGVFGMSDVLIAEKAAVSYLASKVTESLVKRLITASRAS